jgi:hypothetical protein
MKRILAVVVACLVGFALFPCAGLVQSGDQASRAVRRTSSEPGTSAKDQKRVALIIGNSAYADIPLRNSARDAQDISAVMQGLGFTVQTKINANQRQMDEAVNEFIQKVRNGDVALFYFSGHGLQVNGENYLIPVGGKITSEADVHYAAVNVGRILANLEESKNKINIVILDACRNNPFKGLRSYGKGLSPVDAPVGTFIAYATSPGSVAADGTGANSPYTKHLLDALKVEGTSIENVFKRVLRAVRDETVGKQTPWYSSCLPDDFYFRHMARVSPEPALPSREPPQTPPVSRPVPQKPEKLIASVAPSPPAVSMPAARPQKPPIQIEPVKRDQSKENALIEAAEEGRLDGVKRLLSEGVNVNAKDNLGNTALVWARSLGHTRVVDILRKHGALDPEKDAPFLEAAQQGNMSNMERLLSEGADINERSDSHDQATALQYAAMNGYTETVRLLLERGATTDGAYRRAKEWGFTETMQLLSEWNGRHKRQEQ